MTLLQNRLYGFLALLYLLALLWTPFAGSALLKALPIWYLAALAWQRRPRGGMKTLAAALLLASVGDVLLVWDAFLPGLAAFLLAQLLYAWLFSRQAAWRPDRLALACAVLLWAGATLLLVRPALGELAPAVLAYTAAILSMGLAALFSRHALWPAVIGAGAFILSDSLIALGLFQARLPGHDWAVMVTYYLAQWLIARGLIAAAR